MKHIVTFAASLMVAVSTLPATAQTTDTFDLKEWDVSWGGRTRDPYVAPDGKVWFVGQAGNYIAYLDPKSGEQKRFEIEEGTNPHTLIVDAQGTVWYAGNRNGRIGKLDAKTGAIKTIMTGEAKDPHTMVFDGKGNIWFTSQGSNRIGRLNMTTEKVDLVVPNETPSNPVRHRDAPGRAVRGAAPHQHDRQGGSRRRWRSPSSSTRMKAHAHDGWMCCPTARPGTATRRAATSGASTSPPVKPRNGPPRAVAKSASLRADARMTRAASGSPKPVDAKRLVGFDPKTEKFFANIEVSGTIRHMHFDHKTRMMWFGTDANKVGRIALQKAR